MKHTCFVLVEFESSRFQCMLLSDFTCYHPGHVLFLRISFNILGLRVFFSLMSSEQQLVASNDRLKGSLQLINDELSKECMSLKCVLLSCPLCAVHRILNYPKNT